MRANIVSLYAEILRYQIRIIHRYSQPSLIRFLKDVTVAGDWGQDVALITEIYQVLDQELYVLDSQLLKKVESMIVGGFNESHAMLKKFIDETKVTFLPV
jgi:hypothetical protein